MPRQERSCSRATPACADCGAGVFLGLLAQSEDHADDEGRGDEGEHERLNDLDDVGGDPRLKLHCGCAAVQGTKHEGGQEDADGVGLPKQGQL